MIIAITIFVFWFIGLCYVQSMSKLGIPFEWLVNAIIAFIWPYLMLVRWFKHLEFMASMKRKEALKKANHTDKE